MSELKTNLELILQEKNEKIISQNIKKDVEVLDVVGSYDKEDIKELQDELVDAEQELADVKRDLDNSTVTISGSGENVTLNGTAEARFKKPPLPMGNSEQESTTGKNLFNFNNAIKTAGNIDLSNYGVNYSIENQILSLNGTMNATNTFILADLNEDAGSYTLSIDVLGGTISSEVYVHVVTASESKQLILANTNVRLSLSVTEPIEKIIVYIGNEKVFTNYKIRIQLEEGTAATSFEPYVRTEQQVLTQTIHKK